MIEPNQNRPASPDRDQSASDSDRRREDVADDAQVQSQTLTTGTHAMPATDGDVLPAPLAAMAEALRANAEALGRVDDGQRRLADTIERTDNAAQVVTSTRALNETFRGLSEIQRGLLDALVKSRRESGGSGVIILGIVAAALVGALLGALAWDHFSPRDDGQARAELNRLKTDAERQDREIADRNARIREAERQDRSLRAELKGRDEELAAAARTRDGLKEQNRELEGNAANNRAKLENFVHYKHQADRAGELSQTNLILGQKNRQLREQVNHLEKEREKLYGWMGDKLLEMKGGDPEAIMRAAQAKGILKKPKPKPEPGGPVALNSSRERLVKGAINRLLPDSEESLQVVKIGAITNGSSFRDVIVARYRVGRMVGQIVCEEMTIHLDPGSGTIELRCLRGQIVNSGRKGGQIPIGDSGHSEFLESEGIKNWLRRSRAIAEVHADGLLSFKERP